MLTVLINLKGHSTMQKIIKTLAVTAVTLLLSMVSATPALAAATNHTAKKCSSNQHAVTKKTKSNHKTNTKTVCESVKKISKKSTVKKNQKKSHIKKSSAAIAADNKHSATTNANKQTYKGKGQATAVCNDGSDSYATHHQGECSGHDGVQKFL